MKLSLLRVCHRTPGLRRLSRQIHPAWFFRGIYYTGAAAHLLWPHARRLTQPFRAVVGKETESSELRRRALRYLLFLRLFKDLEAAWSNWEARHEDWVILSGETHLRDALRSGRGAILISLHNFGFSKLVAPVLTLRGYRVHRGGNGKKDGRRVSRWGANYKIGWKYIDYGKKEFWNHLKVLKSMQSALAQNEVIHLSPRALLSGDPEMALQFFGYSYYLDAQWFRIFRICQAPVLPCFATATEDGRILVDISPPLPAETNEMARRFARLATQHLKNSPELGRVWKDVYLQRGKL